VVDLALDKAAAVRAQSDVLRIADELRTERDRVSGRVRTLVTSGWTGVAADQYSAGWEEWHAGADELLRALGTIGELMGAVRETIEETDAGSASATQLLVSRLGEVP
jgi:WXG100 family type VII secretion target